MNWYKQKKKKVCDEHNQEEKRHPRVLDTQLLCCGYGENRRVPGEEYEKKSKPNYPVEDQALALTDAYNPKQ